MLSSNIKSTENLQKSVFRVDLKSKNFFKKCLCITSTFAILNPVNQHRAFKMNPIFVKLQAKVEELNENYKKYTARLEAAYRESNSGISPNVDNKGRLHAPCDGYMMPHADKWDYGHKDYSDVLFGKGEFLPFLDDPFTDKVGTNVKDFSSKFKVKVNDAVKAMVIECKEAFSVDVSFGKAWKANGENFRYAWIVGGTLEKHFANFVSEEMVAQVEKKKAEEVAVVKGVAPEGKVRIRGKILRTSVRQTYQVYNSSIYADKVMIELDNKATVYGTLPSSLAKMDKEDLIGMVVEFNANFSHAKDDNTHAFFKNPTKVEIVEEVEEA